MPVSADRGAADPPESRPGGQRISAPEIEAVFDRVEAIAKASTRQPAELAERIATQLKRDDFIADAYTPARLSAPSEDLFAQL
jgi:hypothetical protein